MKILFIDDCNGNELKDPYANLVEVVYYLPKEFLIHVMNVTENKQIGVERSGGNWMKILQDINLEYKLLSGGKLSRYSELDYDIKYKLISGNY